MFCAFFHFRSQKFFVDRGRAFSTLHRATGRDYKNPQTDNYKKTQKRSDSNTGRFCWLKPYLRGIFNFSVAEIKNFGFRFLIKNGTFSGLDGVFLF